MTIVGCAPDPSNRLGPADDRACVAHKLSAGFSQSRGLYEQVATTVKHGSARRRAKPLATPQVRRWACSDWLALSLCATRGWRRARGRSQVPAVGMKKAPQYGAFLHAPEKTRTSTD